jgi:hypothetical protein
MMSPGCITPRSSLCGASERSKGPDVVSNDGMITIAAALFSALSFCATSGSSAQGGLHQFSSLAQLCVQQSTASTPG